MTIHHTKTALKSRRRRLRAELKVAKSEARANRDQMPTHNPYRGRHDSAQDRVRRLEESLRRTEHDLAAQRTRLRVRREKTPVEALKTSRISTRQAQLIGTLSPASMTLLGHLCVPGKPKMWVGLAIFGAFLGSFISVFHNS